jgi:hypothetical protein
MAYTTPRTWVTGEVVTAALLNAQVKGNLDLSAPAIMTTAGDIIYASGANTPARLAKCTSATRYLSNTGTSNVPAWAQINVANGVTGTLPVGNGGTGATTLTDGGVLIGNGTGAMVAMAVLADGEMIVGDGTTDPVAESGATLRSSIGVGTGDSPQFTDLTLTGGCITITGAATDVDLIDNNACALSFDASGQAGILAIDTQNCAEGVKMSGKLTVTGAISSTGALTVGVDDTGHDVKFFGAAAGAFMLYDQSCNLLEVRGATAAGPGHLKLTTGEATVVACDVLGKIEFQAPAECGTDAIVAGANIQAVAQATFSATVNNTDLLFMTGLSGASTEKFRFTANGELGVGGANYGTDGQVLTSTGAGTAPAWEDAAGGGVVAGGTDNAALRADGTGGSTSQGSQVIIADCGLVHAGGGNAAGPVYSFSADTDTGMYRKDANDIGFSLGGTEHFVMADRNFFSGDDANGKMEKGISVNQAAFDGEIFALKSSDVAHGVTCLTETDTYFSIRKGSSSTGGAFFRVGSSGATGWKSQVIITGCANTSKDSGGNGSINFSAGRANGTGYQATNSNGNLMNLTCYDGTNNYTRFLWDAEGSAHAEVEWTTYDDYCDIELLRGVHGAMTPCYAPNYKKTFGQDMVYNLEKYAELGLVGENSMHWETREDGRVQLRGMVNTTSMMMLHHSTIIQMADRFNARLDGLETQLKALTEGK